jgi:tRNA/tmRNA/rRNA uracil-C5-methylase (TrmA/RlmC/RlmD family)
LIVERVRVAGPANGGSCVARVDGRVVFVRGTAPGELINLRVDEVLSKYSRGTAVAILEPHPARRIPPCPFAGVCGGCDWQHLDPAAQRALKSEIASGLLGVPVGVAAVEPDDFGWRTRMKYASCDGKPALHKYRSHELVPVGRCLLEAANPQTRLGDRVFQVAPDGFWQPHVAAPQVLTEAVLDFLRPQPGQSALDLYCGVGLFAAVLADAGCQVTGVEGNREAVANARRNVPAARFFAQDVGKAHLGKADLVVLDPPRKGAGAHVMRELCTGGRIAYVSCDPATLARDIRAAAEFGYELGGIRAFDLFPNTHHVECVALLIPS